MLGDRITSLIRTNVPLAVAAALTWSAAEAGIVLDESTSAQAATVAVAVVASAYYALVRALEARWPALGRLLGSARPPAYGTDVPIRFRAEVDTASIAAALDIAHAQIKARTASR